MKLSNQLIRDHVRDNVTIYLFVSTLFIIGIIFGAIIVNSMNFIQKQELYFHIEQFFNQMNTEESANSIDIFKKSFYFHLKYLTLLFFFGLTIIGIPFIWIFIFLKGIVIGFSIGFIVNQLGLKGFFIALLSIAPHNLIIIPTYIIAGSLAMLFSIVLLQKLFTKNTTNTMGRPFMQYVSIYVVLIVLSFAGSLIESFVAHEAVKLFILRMV